MHSVNQKTNSIFPRVIKNTSIITAGRVVNALCSFAYIPWATKASDLPLMASLMARWYYTTSE